MIILERSPDVCRCETAWETLGLFFVFLISEKLARKRSEKRVYIFDIFCSFSFNRGVLFLYVSMCDIV